jgi:hypothetical protein
VRNATACFSLRLNSLFSPMGMGTLPFVSTFSGSRR